MATATAHASPMLLLDDSVYEDLERSYALEILPPYSGGLWPLSTRRARDLLVSTHVRVPDRLLAPGSDLWLAPIRRARSRFAWIRDSKRPYSTTARPRDITGFVSVSCERGEGAPCGTGIGALEDLDTAAGYADTLSGSLRLRIVLGEDSYNPAIGIDRGLLMFEHRAIMVGAGRDTFALGPSRRTQLAWGTNSPPADHIRVTTSHPIAITNWMNVNGQYILARLRAPQTYSGSLASIVRTQLDLANNIELAAYELVHLGGEGAPSVGVVDFILEHLRRRDSSATTTDSSNRRFGVDIAARVGALAGARFYYSLVFEDIRRARLIDAIRYDTDHLIGIELGAIGRSRRHGVTIEWHQTGVRSQEHTPRTTGFTNAGFAVGAPLGPDLQSLRADARLAFDSFTVYPWLELARMASDTYEFIVDGPINRTSSGEDETRYRIGARVRVLIRDELWLETEAQFEHVDDFGFVSRVTRNNGAMTASIIWYPGGTLGRLAL